MSKEIEYIKSRSQTIAKYSDKLRQSIKSIDVALEDCFSAAGIDVSLQDLHITKEYVRQSNNVCWGIFVYDAECGHLVWIGEASRKVLKSSLENIILLLEKYSKVLEQKELEYESIANMAGKMAECIKDNHHV